MAVAESQVPTPDTHQRSTKFPQSTIKISTSVRRVRTRIPILSTEKCNSEAQSPPECIEKSQIQANETSEARKFARNAV